MLCRLAKPVSMDIDSPPFDRALLDGFAVQSKDACAGAQLHIVGRHDAGGPANCRVAQGQCVAINTGAPLPPGADAVAMVEYTNPIPGAADYIQLTKLVANGAGVQRQSSDARAGQAVLEAGMKLTPAALAVAAAAGADQVWVIPKPRVAVLVTGDELVPVTQRPGPTEIRNTNSMMLTSLVRQCANVPCEVLDLGVARDESETIRTALARGLAGSDVLLVSGGMSMGTRDLVPQLLVELGVEIHVQKVRIKPGKPFIFGTFSPGAPGGDVSQRRYVIGLPGNPVSAFVCFKRFVEPLLRALHGETVNDRVAYRPLPVRIAAQWRPRILPALPHRHHPTPAGGDAAGLERLRRYLYAGPGPGIDRPPPPCPGTPRRQHGGHPPNFFKEHNLWGLSEPCTLALPPARSPAFRRRCGWTPPKGGTTNNRPTPRPN